MRSRHPLRLADGWRALRARGALAKQEENFEFAIVAGVSVSSVSAIPLSGPVSLLGTTFRSAAWDLKERYGASQAGVTGP